MKKKDLITALAPFPDDMEVAICDLRRNAMFSDSDGSSAGIYQEFEIEKIEDIEERDPGRVSPEDKAAASWVSLSFKNDELEDLFNPADERKCRICGCTALNCLQCIKKTGRPCHWVEEDLCSACLPDASDKGGQLTSNEETLFKSAEYWEQETLKLKRLLYVAWDCLDNSGYFEDHNTNDDLDKIIEFGKKYPNGLNPKTTHP